jgi:hypothetical protein
MANDNEDNGESNEDEEPDGPDFDAAAESSDAIKRAKLKTLRGMEEDEAARIKARSGIMDLVERGRQIAMEEAVCYPNVRNLQGGMTEAKPTDPNRWVAFAALFGNGEDRPHVDTFRGRLVDHRGVIIDDHYSMVELTCALNAMGLKGHSASEVQKAFRQWALMVKNNDLISRFEKVIPVWDGVPRMEKSLIDVFECGETELNKRFSVYFWLSIYCRVLDPGCFAPMVLCLIGTQFTGKSHFSNIICREIIGDPKKNATELNLDKDHMEFLREITGNSVIANVGEMSGYNRADLNKIKAFITRTSDTMHYKYEGHFEQHRQWIIIMDGNKYDGLQRDETGNRRFYPFFVGEMHDDVRHGYTLKEKWTNEYCVQVAATIWPIMAECREWMSKNGGGDGYLEYAKAVSNEVMDFNQKEMDGDRGTIRDEELDIFLVEALKLCEVIELNRTKNKGMFVTTKEIVNKVAAISRDKIRVKMNHLPNKMKALGGEPEMINNAKGYIFRSILTYSDFVVMLKGGGQTEDEQIAKDRVIDPNINM